MPHAGSGGHDPTYRELSPGRDSETVFHMAVVFVCVCFVPAPGVA